MVCSESASTLSLDLIGAEWRDKTTEPSIEAHRLAVLMFLQNVIILDAAIAQIAADRLSGQLLLFRDTASKLAEQLQMATDLSTWFNELASEVGAAEMDLEEVRSSLRSATNRQISIWVHLARTEALSTFGTEEEMHAAMDQYFLLFKSKCPEAPMNSADA